MRNIVMGVVMVLSAVTPASASVYRSQVRGSGVVATFTVTDGCFVTTGELAAVTTTTDGTSAIVSAQRTDNCAEGGPVSWFYLSGGPVSLSTNGVVTASVHGSIAMSPYSGPTGGDVTLDLWLAFRGTGAVDTTTSHYASHGDGSLTLSFSSTRQRNATTTGFLKVDGAVGSVTSAQLVTSVQGELVVTH